MALCAICREISPWSISKVLFNYTGTPEPSTCTPHYVSFLDLQASGMTCALCRLICESLLANEYTSRPLRQEAPIFLALSINHYVDWEILAPQLSEIVVTCGERFTLLSAFAEEGSGAALSNAVAGRAVTDPGSTEGFGIVSKWLQGCIHGHTNCRIGRVRQLPDDLSVVESVKLPLRLLDVRRSDQPNIRLFESTSCAQLEGQYVALSHRWPVDPSQHFTTTHSSIAQRKSRICLEELPEAFRDAVILTRKLGLRYLWIDSLCIIQDDPGDWARQSVLMGQIYHNATITVMAASTPSISSNNDQSHSSEGFLRARPSAALPVVRMPYYSNDLTLDGTWFIRAQKPSFSQSMELFTRGWVMQEEMLPRRRILYTPSRMVWVCTIM